MRTDFLDAHQRHWDDAELLFKEERWANADHLYGLAAECGLKRLMLAFGMPFNQDRGEPANRKDLVHANAVWDRFESYREGRGLGTEYVLPALNPFQGWRISDRYAHRSDFDPGRAQVHRDGATIICRLVETAQREGWFV